MTHAQETKGWTSASNSQSDALCPGRNLACHGLLEESNTDSESGTRIHGWLAAEAVIGGSESEMEIFHTLQDRESKLLKDWLPDCDKFDVHREQRLWTEFPDLEQRLLRHSGKLDAYVVGIGRAILWDYKTGNREPTESAKNLQLRDQAVLLWKNRPELTQITVAILWPYAAPEMCDYEIEDLQRAYSDLVHRALNSNDPKSPRRPGEVQCRYCRARATDRCPETQQAVIELPKLDVATIPSPKLLEACMLAEGIIKSVKERARAALGGNPDSIPGFALKENSPNEPITDVTGAWSRAFDFGLPRDAFLACAKLSKGDLEAALKKLYRTETKRDRIPLKEWSDKWEAFLAGITTTEPKQPTIVRIA